ncbi:hypothetical protein EDD85DRAFT_792676 [Armillaria nabsnona]|nr:hypothetical protein EDD85DRAFT_792676 [Armillaria nabsnona]
MVLLLPWILGMNGDNPMQSKFSSHIGRSDHDTTEFDRLKEFVLIGWKHHKENVIDVLGAQLTEILRGAPSNASSMATATGVKDKYFQHFANELAAVCLQVKEQQHNDPSLSGAKHLTEKLKEL